MSLKELQETLVDPSLLPNSFYIHLKKSVVSTPSIPTTTTHATTPSPSTSRILLVHGFNQSHTAWLKTGIKLHDTYNHEIVIPDLYGHGNNAVYLLSPQDLDVLVLVQQLRKIVLELQWNKGKKIVLAGISMGGAVVQLYSLFYPEDIDRLVLVASGGMSESCYHPIYFLRGVARNILKWFGAGREQSSWSYSHQLLSCLKLVSTAPEYRVPQTERVQNHLMQFPMSLVWGGYDVVHSFQLNKRRNGREKSVNVLYVPYMSHLICSYVDGLSLEKYPHFWNGSVEGCSVDEVSWMEVMRAKL